MQKKKSNANVNGKGYYIALVLCAVAIGLTGFLYYRHADSPQDTLQAPTNAVAATNPGGDVQAVATQPNEAVTPTQPAKKPAKIQAPVAGKTVAEYSMDALCYNQTTRDWRVHDGVDFAAEAGATVSAAADGTVYTVYEDETMGMTVVVKHDGGYTTKYASLGAEVSVKAGDNVTAGQKIGVVGCTALLENAIGDHLHFSVSCNGTVVDPVEFLGTN